MLRKIRRSIFGGSDSAAAAAAREAGPQEKDAAASAGGEPVATESTAAAASDPTISYAYRVVEVHASSPCQVAKLVCYFDFITHVDDICLDKEKNTMSNLIPPRENKLTKFTIYNSKNRTTRGAN